METKDVLDPQMTVEEVLKLKPCTWVVFRACGTDCIGCFMQRFCSLQDVAEAYHLPLERLMDELQSSKSDSRSLV